MREICSSGSVGEPVGNHRLYPDVRRFLALPKDEAALFLCHDDRRP